MNILYLYYFMLFYIYNLIQQLILLNTSNTINQPINFQLTVIS